MKILMINYMETTAPGGINKTVMEIAKNLSNREHEVVVLQPNPYELEKEEMNCGFKIIRVKSRLESSLYGLNPALYRYVKKNFRKFNPDIVHIHGYHTLLFPELVYIIKKINSEVPIVFTPHYDPLNRNTLAGKIFGGIYNSLLGKKTLKNIEYIISISNFESNNIKMIQDTRMTVIPNGIDFIDIKKKIKDDIIKILYVGYLLDYKGVQHIIKAVHQLVKFCNVKNVKFTVIGEGNYKNSLLKLSKRLCVEDYIVWKPFVPHDEILKEMKKSDIFLLLSKSEGYGIVVAESLSMGTPTIITKKTALEEFLNEPGCFGVNNPPDPKEIADLILKIYNDDIKVGPFSDKIRTWDKVAEAYESVYNEVLGVKNEYISFMS